MGYRDIKGFVYGLLVSSILVSTVFAAQPVFEDDTETADANDYFYEMTEDHGTAHVPILLYHHIRDYGGRVIAVTPERFEDQMRALHEAGYTTLSMNDLYDYVFNGVNIHERSVVITFDDGYLSNYEKAFPILQKYNFKATIFIIGVSFGKNTYKNTILPIKPHFNEEQAKEMVQSGLISIQSHSYDMHQLLPYDRNPRSGVLRQDGEEEGDYIDAFRDDYEKERELIKRVTGEDIIAFAYPFGLHDALSAELLHELGVKITFLAESGKNTLTKGVPSSLLGLRRYTIEDTVLPDELLQLISE